MAREILNHRIREYGKVKIHEHATFEQAQMQAYAESASTGGYTFPITIAQQGSRPFLAGALPIVFVESRLVSRAASKGASMADAMSASNRPLDAKHVRDIARYISENVEEGYILPSVTLNVQEEINVHTMKGAGDYKTGYISMPIGVTFTITDGQHRVQAIKEALMQLDKTAPGKSGMLRKDSLSVMITCEHDIKQIHQDFADCSKTKSLPNSLLSVFDMRNPANRMVIDLVERCPVFTDKIDSTSKTLSKKSAYIFLANQIRQLIKHLLMRGNPTDADFEKRAKEMFGDKRYYENYLAKYVEFINLTTENIEPLRIIASINADSPKRALIPKMREEGWVCLTVTGLNVIGSLGYDIFTNEIEDWQDYITKLSTIDWSRHASIWEGNIVQTGKMMTQTGPVRRAVSLVEEAIGLNFLVEERNKTREERKTF